jgi:hypothetical protein
VGEANPGAEQHPEPLNQGSLHTVGASSVLVGRSRQKYRDDIEVRAPRDRVASDDAAVEVGAVQARSELTGQQARGRVGQALVLGLQVGEVGLGLDVALVVKLIHLVIVADQAPSWCWRPRQGRR